jgi:hypothetical protein
VKLIVLSRILCADDVLHMAAFFRFNRIIHFYRLQRAFSYVGSDLRCNLGTLRYVCLIVQLKLVIRNTFVYRSAGIMLVGCGCVTTHQQLRQLGPGIDVVAV